MVQTPLNGVRGKLLYAKKFPPVDSHVNSWGLRLPLVAEGRSVHFLNHRRSEPVS